MASVIGFETGKKALLERPDLEELDDEDVLELDLCQMSDIIDCMIDIDKALNRLKEITGLGYDEAMLKDEEE